MSITARGYLKASVVALTLGLAAYGVAAAQSDQTAAIGIITGEVAHCINGAEQPAPQVSVGVDGGSGSLARTDADGSFLLALPAGTYTVVATASDGSANRQYVPVEGGQTLDIGVLDIGGGVAGCGPDSDISAPILPTFTPTSVAAPAAPASPTLMPAAPAQPTLAPMPEPAPTQPDPTIEPDTAA